MIGICGDCEHLESGDLQTMPGDDDCWRWCPIVDHLMHITDKADHCEHFAPREETDHE